MAESTDTEELDVSSAPHSRRPSSPKTSKIKITDNAKLLNAANNDVRINDQNVEIAREAKEVAINDGSNHFENTGVIHGAPNPINLYFPSGSPYDSMSRPYPRDPPAAFTHNLMRNCLPPISSHQPAWDELHDRFSDPRELDLQRENTNALWHDTKVTHTMHGLDTAIVKFLPLLGSKDRSSKKSSWTLVKQNIRQAGRKARDYYKQDYLPQTKMADMIRNINHSLASEDDLQFLGWLDWLPEYKHRHCLADPVRYILVAVIECYPFDRLTIGYLEDILSLFSNSTAYVQLCRERRPTADMITTTVEIFTQTAELLTSLLDYGRRKKREKGKHPNQIPAAIDRLRRTLADINRSAIVKLRGGGRVKWPRVDERNSELLLVTRIHNLCRDVPAMHEVRENAYYTRQMSRIATDSQHMDWSTDASSDARHSIIEDVISKKQVLDALSFRGSDTMKDINECLTYAEISGYEKARLAVLTREEAFQDWLMEERWSTALVIHGNLDDDGNSPISYLAAQIGGKYRKKRGFIVLSWFCGLNTDENEAAIIARLAGQLLSQATRLLPSEEFNTISRHEYKKLKQRDLKTLMAVFSSIIQKLRSNRIVVFCLIDSISTYETGDFDDTEKLVKFFRDLVRSMRRQSRVDVKHELIFKLLFSDGQSSELAAKYFKKEIIEMDDEVDTDVDSDASIVGSD